MRDPISETDLADGKKKKPTVPKKHANRSKRPLKKAYDQEKEISEIKWYQVEKKEIGKTNFE